MFSAYVHRSNYGKSVWTQTGETGNLKGPGDSNNLCKGPQVTGHEELVSMDPVHIHTAKLIIEMPLGG